MCCFLCPNHPKSISWWFQPRSQTSTQYGNLPQVRKKNTSELTGASADLFSDDPENSHDRFPPKGGFSKGNPWKSPYFRKSRLVNYYNLARWCDLARWPFYFSREILDDRISMILALYPAIAVLQIPLENIQDLLQKVNKTSLDIRSRSPGVSKLN